MPERPRTDALVDGWTEPEYDAVRTLFADQIAGRQGAGAAVAVWTRGGYVVDLWGGWADKTRTRPWQRDSITQPYSVSKPFAAACVLLLVDRGAVALDDDLRDYWPGLQATVTVRQALCHQSGLVALDDPAPTHAFLDWDLMCDLLSRQRPLWEPGSAHGESALFYGHPLGQIVRSVDGRSLGRFLQDEVCGPRGLDFWIGLPESEQHRAVEMTGFETAFGPTLSEGRPPLFDRALRNPPGALEAAVVNSTSWRAAEVPAINGHGTARAVAGFYAALATGEILGPDLLAEATAPVSRGVDRVIGTENAWGLGFGVDDDGWGMGGIGGHLGIWSAEGEFALGFVTGGLGGYEDVTALENAVRAVHRLPPL